MPGPTTLRVPVQPGCELVPDHLMLYCNDSPGSSVRTSVPVPGKQSLVDQIRLPAGVVTVNTWREPETSCVQVAFPELVTVSPRIGFAPEA